MILSLLILFRDEKLHFFFQLQTRDLCVVLVNPSENLETKCIFPTSSPEKRQWRKRGGGSLTRYVKSSLRLLGNAFTFNSTIPFCFDNYRFDKLSLNCSKDSQTTICFVNKPVWQFGSLSWFLKWPILGVDVMTYVIDSIKII